jgi:multicomponent Na+:H+ antiporter subunit E
MRNGVLTSLLAARRALLMALVWFILAGPDPEALLPGVLAVGAATWLSLRLLPPVGWVRLARLLLLLPGFLWRSLVGGADVAARAFHPRMPLSPGWVEVPSRLPGGGRAVLGGTFSLMPGTLVAGTRRGRLLVHCLDRRQPVERAVEAEEAAFGSALARPAETAGG